MCFSCCTLCELTLQAFAGFVGKGKCFWITLAPVQRKTRITTCLWSCLWITSGGNVSNNSVNAPDSAEGQKRNVNQALRLRRPIFTFTTRCSGFPLLMSCKDGRRHVISLQKQPTWLNKTWIIFRCHLVLKQTFSRTASDNRKKKTN